MNEEYRNEKSEKREKSNDDSKQKEENFSGVANYSNESNHVLSQTTRAPVSSRKKQQEMMIILFDSGSQVSYITPKATKSQCKKMKSLMNAN